MALTSSSSISDIVSQYVDSSLYDVDNSLPMARLFIQACRILLIKRPKSISTDGVSTQFDPAQIRAELERANAFVAVRSRARQAGSVRLGDISDIRR